MDESKLPEHSDVQVVVSALFVDDMAQNGKNAIETKATATGFEDGDMLGLYAVRSGGELNSASNLINNHKLKVGASGIIAGESSPAYYPDKQTNLDLYSYYPYQSGNATADALGVLVGIRMIQADISSLTQSDLCYGSRLNVTPTASSQVMTFSHKFAQIKFNFSLYPSCPAIKTVKLLHIKDQAKLNLQSGALSELGGEVDVTAYSNTATQFTAIIPAQSLTGACIEIELVDGTIYYYNAPSPIAIVASATNQINLSITDRLNISLDGGVSILPWGELVENGSVKQPIANDFTLLWRLPHIDHPSTQEVVVSVLDPVTGKVGDYSATAVTKLPTTDDEVASFTFAFNVPLGDGFSYPYLIEAVTFVDAGGAVIQKCASLVAANVARSGPYTLGVEQDNLIFVSVGSINSWVDLSISGGISGGGVANSFVVRLIEPESSYVSAKTLALTIGGFRHIWATTPTAGSNSLLAILTSVSFPDDNNNAPKLYPYAVERVEVLTASGEVVSDNACYVEVGRGGTITINVSRSGITSTIATVNGWGTPVDGGGVTDFTGPTSSNAMRLIFCDGVAGRAGLVTKAVLTIGGQSVTLSPYLMSVDNPFVAVSTSTIDLITAGVGGVPSNYPYTITRVQLFDKNNVELFSAAASIKVKERGAVSIRAMQ